MTIDERTPPSHTDHETPHQPALLEPLLFELAASHHGMLTTEMARGLGYDKFALASLTKSGALLHPCRGLYAVAELVDRRTVESWHKHLTFGGRMLYPDAILVGATALVVHDIPVWNTNLNRPAFFRPRDRSAAASAFWVRPRVCRDILDTPLGPTQTIAASVIQHCLDNGMTQGVVSADAAMQMGLTSPEELAAVAETVQSWPRSNRTRTLLTFIDERHETPGESIVAVFAGAAGIELVPQVTIRELDGTFVARVDFIVKGTKVIVEFDGRRKYVQRDNDPGSGPWGKNADEKVFEEKQREDRLRALGYVVVRLVWSDFYTRGAVVAKIRAGMALERKIYGAR